MNNSTLVAPIICIPPIGYFAKAAVAKEVIIDAGENYVKQSIRNRYHILSANGVLTLSIPVISQGGEKIPTGDIKIDYSKEWQRNHLRAINAAYRSAPFYDYYAGAVTELIESGAESLREFAEKSAAICDEWLGYEISRKVENAFQEGDFDCDLRLKIKRPEDFPGKPEFKTYVQVFADRFEFQPNLSILDLIFNLGPEAGYFIKEMS